MDLVGDSMQLEHSAYGSQYLVVVLDFVGEVLPILEIAGQGASYHAPVGTTGETDRKSSDIGIELRSVSVQIVSMTVPDFDLALGFCRFLLRQSGRSRKHQGQPQTSSKEATAVA